MPINFTFAPQGKTLYEYYHDRNEVCLIRGPFGSGKTTQAFQKLFRHMQLQPPNKSGVRPVRYACIRNTYSVLMTTSVKDWLDMFGELGQYRSGGKEPPNHRFKVALEDGTTLQAELYFIAADRNEHIEKFKGTQFTGLVVNETNLLPKPIFDVLTARHGRYPNVLLGGVECGWHGLIGDYNSHDEDHWLYELATNPPDGWSFYHQPGGVIWDGDKWVVNENAENAVNLPKDYYLNSMRGKSNDWIKVFLANEYGFAVDGKPIYPEFSESLHVSKMADYIPGLRVYRGWDFGLTPACTFSQIRTNGQFSVFHEVTSERSSIDALSDSVLLDSVEYGFKDVKDYGDPSGEAGNPALEEASCFDVLHGKRIQIEGSDQSPTIRKESLRHTMTRLSDGKPMLMVHPRAKMVIKGLRGGYCLRRLRISGERFSDFPDKNEYSHPVEALEYTAARLFGDRVRSRDNQDKKHEPIRRRQSIA